MQTIELLPCPFCGSDAEYEENYFGKDVYVHRVQCSKCRARQPAAPFDTKEVGAKLWNTRVPAFNDTKWQLVPIEPTEEMARAGGNSKVFGLEDIVGFMTAMNCYKAMLQSAPKPQEE